MSFPLRGSIVLLLALAPLTCGCSTKWGRELSEQERERLHHSIRELQVEVLRARAERAVLQAEVSLLENPFLPTIPSVKSADLVGAQQILFDIHEKIRKEVQHREKVLNQFVEQARAEEQTALNQLHQAQNLAWQEKARLYAVNRQLQAEGNATDWSDVWDWLLVLIVLLGLFLVLLGFLLGIHVQRVWLRQLKRSGLRFVLVLLALGLSASVALANERDDLQRQLDELTAMLKTEQAKIEELRDHVRSKRAEILAYWQNMLNPSPSVNGVARIGDDLAKWDHKAYQLLHEAMVLQHTTQLATEQTTQLLQQVQTDRDNLPKLIDRSYTLTLVRSSVKLLACFGFLVAGFAPLWIARHRVQRLLTRDRQICPRCLSQGKLSLKTAKTDPRYPKISFVSCQECHHEFPTSHLHLPRLCFPTVGSKKSGKTHWLVTIYDLVKNSKARLNGRLENTPSLADTQFEQLVTEVLDSYQSPDATPIDRLPAPLTFYTADGSSLGSHEVLLNLFDFGGEMMNMDINRDELRRRALLMDGFVFFLDPTQVRREGASIGLEAQIRQLTKFRTDMRQIRQLGPGTRLRVPLAVCISKIDLLVTKNPMGETARPWVAELRQTAKLPLTLQTLQLRSRLVSKALKPMFQNWDLEKALRENFGEHFLFFPLTPVSLVDRELGIEDRRRRTYAPFGILEPILWLLYMRGYNVLN